MKNCEKGFSLIEVLIVSGIGLFIATAFFQMTISQSKALTYMEDRMAAMDFKSIVTSYFLDEQSCRETLNGLSSTSANTVNTIRDRNRRVLYSTTGPQSAFGDFLNIAAMGLQPQTAGPVAANSIGMMDLIVEFNRGRASGSKTAVYVTIPVTVQLTGTTVTTCIASGGTLASVSNPGGTGGTQNPTGGGGSTGSSSGSCTEGYVQMRTNCSGSNNVFCQATTGSLQQCRNGTWRSVGHRVQL